MANQDQGSPLTQKDVVPGREFREELGRKIAEMESVLEKLRQLAAAYDDVMARERPGPARGTSRREPIRKKTTRYDRIESILKESGRPLTVWEITARLQQRGDGAGALKSMFYNVVDGALRSGWKRGRYQRNPRTGDTFVWGLAGPPSIG